MKLSVYELLEYGDPQALQNLHDYQKNNYGTGISKPQNTIQFVTIDCRVEGLTEIAEIMSQAPSRSRNND